uniref:Polynucleotide kinase n=1 Tax=viral metagenome TaxID=1070528 RepID=A0A6M3L2E4_9ZZZZ
MEKGWIGIDLDGTLAEYDTWRGIEHIGNPVIPMVNTVKLWLDHGYRVKIFTARAVYGQSAIDIIHQWCEQNSLPALEVTNIKDFAMIELWDDRCFRIETNTGRILSIQ